MLKKTVIFLAAMALSLGSASAATYLYIDDPYDTTAAMLIGDGSGLDANGAVGAITFIGGVGDGNWSLTVTTGIGSPNIGTPAFPQVDLNSVSTSDGAGVLYLGFFETDLNTLSDPLNFTFNIGGTTVGSVESLFCVDSGNTTTWLVSTECSGLLGGSGGAFSDSDSGAFSGLTGGPFAAKIFVGIEHGEGRGQITSFDAHGITAAPEPATMLLFSTALLGLGLIRRKKN